MTSRATLFAPSIKCLSSNVMVMMLSMNPSIYAFVAVISTAKGSSSTRCLIDCCLFSCGSNDLCGEFRSSVSQYSSRSRLFPKPISASLTVVYYSCASVGPKGNCRYIKAILSTISMHVDLVVIFACIWK